MSQHIFLETFLLLSVLFLAVRAKVKKNEFEDEIWKYSFKYPREFPAERLLREIGEPVTQSTPRKHGWRRREMEESLENSELFEEEEMLDLTEYWDKRSKRRAKRYAAKVPRCPVPGAEARGGKGGKVLLAQDEYMLIHVKGYDDCTTIHVREEFIDEKIEMKLCDPSERRQWFWVYPFRPESHHLVLVYSSTTAELLFAHNVTSLPVYPPAVRDVSVTGANGWIQLTFLPVSEDVPGSQPGLVGYRVGYRWDEADDAFPWQYVYSRDVDWLVDAPYVRPVHPCPAFRRDRTFCVLLTDHVRLRDERDARHYRISIQTFRIVPDGEEELYSPEIVNTTFKLKACDWVKRKDCPEIGETKTDFARRKDRIKRDATTTQEGGNNSITLPLAIRKQMDPNTVERSTKPAEDAWFDLMKIMEEQEQEKRRKRRQTRAAISYRFRGKEWTTLAYLAGCAVLSLLTAHFLGYRYGRYKGQQRWNNMRSHGASRFSLERFLNEKRLVKLRTTSLPSLDIVDLNLEACKSGSPDTQDGTKERGTHVRRHSLPCPISISDLIAPKHDAFPMSQDKLFLLLNPAHSNSESGEPMFFSDNWTRLIKTT